MAILPLLCDPVWSACSPPFPGPSWMLHSPCELSEPGRCQSCAETSAALRPTGHVGNPPKVETGIAAIRPPALAAH